MKELLTRILKNQIFNIMYSDPSSCHQLKLLLLATIQLIMIWMKIIKLSFKF